MHEYVRLRSNSIDIDRPKLDTSRSGLEFEK